MILRRLLQAIVLACAAWLTRWLVDQFSDNYHTNTAMERIHGADRVPPRPAKSDVVVSVDTYQVLPMSLADQQSLIAQRIEFARRPHHF